MAKLSDDPAVKALLEKAITVERTVGAKVHKTLLKLHLATIKSTIAEQAAAAKAAGDKSTVLALKTVQANLIAGVTENTPTPAP
jgi:hypothetical protein